MRSTLSFLATLFAAQGTLAATYNILDTFIGPSFLTGFDHQAIADPTHGRVNYVNQATALAQNLTYTSSDTLILRADYKTVLSSSGPGRNSVRIQSKKAYGNGVSVINSTATTNWPSLGEIDIIEGVNDQSPNHSTLHTTDGCTMNPGNMVQTGSLATTNCYWQVNGNSGCGVAVNKPNNYGPAFNANGGGWNDNTVPNDVKNGASSVNTANWGTPYANFVDNNCNFQTHFGNENLIINLTLYHVNQDPADFKNAYWDIASLRVYQ
ncbi:hypothetical protein FRC00_009893 [Tulasnella sp. 408]|nr:hypothetical protein FRC00_009893 [Tulasnella sp. 408]